MPNAGASSLFLATCKQQHDVRRSASSRRWRLDHELSSPSECGDVGAQRDIEPHSSTPSPGIVDPPIAELGMLLTALQQSLDASDIRLTQKDLLPIAESLGSIVYGA
jgi:hypothetical protein